MPYNDKQKQRKAEKAWQAQPKNRERRKQLKRERIAKRLAEIQKYKAENPCVDCGGKYHPECMDFDHIGDGNKFEVISRMISGGYSEEKVKKEIEKCELVCSNCHRLRTFNRRI